jgi:two-component system sensor histidine kinase PilS (NtrC family)
MRQNEKMAAVGQLAAGIAHEIRNPLASISGSVQLLGSSLKPQQEEEHRLMKIVLREIDRLNNLITEFLDFVRPDVLKDDPIDLNQLIRDVAEMLKLNKNLRSDVAQDLDLQATVEISGNRDKLKQALLNIIINAYQAMNDTPEPRITIRTSSEDGKVTLKIRDRGCGIDEVGLRRMFDPFHTTKPKGTGLGLAVTHKIIESHHGHIEVESAKGVGTEFTLEFPAREPGRTLDQNALVDSQQASENFSIAFRGQKRGNG